MTEHQIQDGYQRLDGALAPPVDSAERIGRQVAAHRRRRRTAIAGVGAAGVLAAGGIAVVALGGDDGSGPQVAVDSGPGPVSTLTMTRPDGSTYTFRDVTVTCEAPESEDTGTVAGPQRIWALSPRKIEGERVLEPFLYFRGIVAKVAGDRTFTFPNDWMMSSEHVPMVLFAADTDGNEVASNAGGESGTVRVVEASCDPTPVLRLAVDMTLGSEEQKQSLDMAGTLD